MEHINNVTQLNTTKKTISNNPLPRRFLEVDHKIAAKVRLLCFLKNITMKEFVTDALKREIEPYESWLINIKELEKNT